jgi:hypothetical protein
VVNGGDGLPNAAPLRTGSVGAIILNFKSVTARRVNQMRKMKGISVWQRNYYENIIRDENVITNYSNSYLQQSVVMAARPVTS